MVADNGATCIREPHQSTVRRHYTLFPSWFLLVPLCVCWKVYAVNESGLVDSGKWVGTTIYSDVQFSKCQLFSSSASLQVIHEARARAKALVHMGVSRAAKGRKELLTPLWVYVLYSNL